MKWIKLKSIYCSVPNNTESYDRVVLNIDNKKQVSIGKMTYDQSFDLSRYAKLPLEAETLLVLHDTTLFGKKTILGEYKAKLKRFSNSSGEIRLKRKGDYILRYRIEIKNTKKYFKLTQIVCEHTVASIGQDKVYLLFNNQKYQSKFILKTGKVYSMDKYPPIYFKDSLEIAFYASELLRSDQLIGKKKLEFEFVSLGEKEIVFDRDSCLYQLKVEVLDLKEKK